jgi:Acetoacetate decarboxylase (ADC)
MELKPAPWELTGEAIVIVHKFSEKFVKTNGYLSDYQSDNWNGGLGAVMCVNYQTSNVGPYFELLFIPGTINLKNLNLEKIKSGFTISKIYVSTMNSVENGKNNWGIPKELADFQWINIDRNTTEIKVSIDGIEFFTAIFKNKSFSIPITTSFIPLKIIQKLDEKYFRTEPKASGKASFAKVEEMKVEQKYFPKINECKPILVSKISNFKMIFPTAEIGIRV